MILPGLPCSFRGVRFRWDERGGETTPRFAEHDWPQKAGRWHEDMAPGPRVFTFSGFLIAPTTLLVRAELVLLERACRDQRPGLLLHPVFGLLACVSKGFRWTESKETLNRIDLDLTFVEDLQPIPQPTRWIGSALADAVAAAAQAITSAIDAAWDLVALPAYALQDAAAALADVVDTIGAATALLTQPVQAAVSIACTTLEAGTPVTATIADLPQEVGVGMCGAFGAFTTDSFGNPLDLTSDQANATYAALRALSLYQGPAEATNTTSRAIVAQAMAGLSATVRRLALMQMANLTRSMTFASSGDAIALRDQLSDAMAVEILAAADQASADFDEEAGTVSDALDRVRAEMVADLTATAATLVPVASITLTQTQPSGRVAYALYGDGDGSATARAETLALEEDFIARNGVQDPGLVPGGVPLEYLVETSQVSP